MRGDEDGSSGSLITPFNILFLLLDLIITLIVYYLTITLIMQRFAKQHIVRCSHIPDVTALGAAHLRERGNHDAGAERACQDGEGGER